MPRLAELLPPPPPPEDAPAALPGPVVPLDREPLPPPGPPDVIRGVGGDEAARRDAWKRTKGLLSKYTDIDNPGIRGLTMMFGGVPAVAALEPTKFAKGAREVARQTMLPVTASELAFGEMPVPRMGPQYHPEFEPPARPGGPEVGTGGMKGPNGEDPNLVKSGGVVPQAAPAQGGGGGGGGGPVGPQEQWKIGPTARKFWADYFNSAEGAAGAMQGVQARQAAEMEDLYARQAKDEQAREDARRQAEMARQQELLAKQQEYDQSVKELGSMKIDPNHYWSSKNTGEKMANLIAIFMGGLAGALDKSGRNQVIEELNKQRDYDIDAQKSMMEAKKDYVRGKQTLFGMTLQRTGDARAAEALAKAAATERLGLEAQRIGAKFKGEDAQARLQMLLADLDKQKADFMTQAISYGVPGGGGGGGMTAGTMDIDRNNIVKGPDGFDYAFRSGGEAEKYRAKEAVSRQLSQASQVLENLDKTASLKDKLNPVSNYNVRRNQIISGSLQAINTQVGGGVMSAHEGELMANYFGTQKGVSHIINPDPNLHSRFREFQAQNLNDSLQSGNTIKGREVMAEDQKHRIATRFYPLGYGTTVPAPGAAQAGPAYKATEKPTK